MEAVQRRLAQLEQARLVDGKKVGRETRFAATPAPLTDAIAWMTAVGEQRDDRLAALGEAIAPNQPR